MKATIPVKGATLPACWALAGALAAGVLAWLLADVRWGTGVFALLAGVLVPLCYLHRIGYTVEVRGRELVVTRGFFFRTVLKVPVRYISSTGRLSTPLSRRLDTGLLTVTSSGRLTVIVGLPTAEMSRLRRLLTERQV